MRPPLQRPLSERLQALRSGPPRRFPASDTAELVRRIERLRSGPRSSGGSRELRITDDAELARRLGARVAAPGLLLLETDLPRDRYHGHLQLSALEGLLSELPEAAGTAPEQWLFLDTETTGLSGGSGTLAFLVGIARYRKGCLRVRQYLITRFSGEEALLRSLVQDIDGGATLVSYNGKSFDLPLLATRMGLHRLENPLPGLPHLDLLHPVRRRFSGQWENCRLATVERELLGFGRDGDLPGSQAPRAWLDYVKQGRWQRLQGVIDHNRLDLVSLAVLLPALGSGSVPTEKVRQIQTGYGLRHDHAHFRKLRLVLAC